MRTIDKNEKHFFVWMKSMGKVFSIVASKSSLDGMKQHQKKMGIAPIIAEFKLTEDQARQPFDFLENLFPCPKVEKKDEKEVLKRDQSNNQDVSKQGED